MTDNNNETYTPVEVASILKITKNTVYELVKRNELKGFKVGKKLRINKKDVYAYLNRGESRQEKASDHSQDIVYSTPVLNSSEIKTNREMFVISGQDMILDVIAGNLQSRMRDVKFVRSYSGSYNALMGLYFGEVQAATAHLWDGETGEYNIPYIKRIVPGIQTVVIGMVKRRVGLYVQKGNPKNIHSLSDLLRSDVAMINREKGSGIRVFLDESLKKMGVSGSGINGYYRESPSHLVVAGTVARGGADAGIGNQKTAEQVNGIDEALAKIKGT
jgi:putative molybdopterin biosynthesis protein